MLNLNTLIAETLLNEDMTLEEKFETLFSVYMEIERVKNNANTNIDENK